MNKWFATLAIGLLAFSAAPLHAQSMTERLLATCAKETEDAKRLSCYDQLAASLKNAQPAPAAATKVQNDTTKEAEFGLRNSPADKKRVDESPKEITAAVTKIDKRGTGELVITLENGQTWAQIERLEYFPLKVGDTVRISSAALGSYRLVAPSKRGTRVTRLH
jgi:hypothetical protein